VPNRCGGFERRVFRRSQVRHCRSAPKLPINRAKPRPFKTAEAARSQTGVLWSLERLIGTPRSTNLVFPAGQNHPQGVSRAHFRLMTVLNGEIFYQAPASFAMFDDHARGTEPTPGTAQGN
jgi:hypothetical protein